MNVRVNELIALVREVSGLDFADRLFGHEAHVRIDTTSVVVAGHSYGGITAVEFGKRELPNGVTTKAVIGYDVSWYAHGDEILDKSYYYSKDSPPIYLISSTTYPKMAVGMSGGKYTKQAEYLSTFSEKSVEEGALLEHVELVGFHHESMCDFVALLPIETHFKYKEIAPLNVGNIYGLTAKLAINFLDKMKLVLPKGITTVPEVKTCNLHDRETSIATIERMKTRFEAR